MLCCCAADVVLVRSSCSFVVVVVVVAADVLLLLLMCCCCCSCCSYWGRSDTTRCSCGFSLPSTTAQVTAAEVADVSDLEELAAAEQPVCGGHPTQAPTQAHCHAVLITPLRSTECYITSTAAHLHLHAAATAAVSSRIPLLTIAARPRPSHLRGF